MGAPCKKRDKSWKRPQNFAFGVKYGAHQKSEKSAQNFLWLSIGPGIDPAHRKQPFGEVSGDFGPF